jgi:ParB family transcriptional regulator, chromosome partitioning protein
MAQISTQKFLTIPIGYIVIEPQIRSTIDMKSPSSLALIDSIRLYGILEPLLVKEVERDMYLLVCGERRFWAADAAGLNEVPVIILPANTPESEILALQLTENLQREDLNVIDLAHGVMKYLKVKKVIEKDDDVEGAMGILTRYKLRPETLGNDVVPIIGTILQITGKSITTLVNALSILKLGNEIQEAIKAGTILPTLGYVLAANMDSPAFKKACALALAGEATVKELEKLFATAKAAPPQTKPPAMNFSRQCQTLQNWRTVIEKDAAKYGQEELQRLRDELRGLLEVVEGKVVGK